MGAGYWRDRKSSKQRAGYLATAISWKLRKGDRESEKGEKRG